MDTLILIGSIIGILNSFILIIYASASKKGNRIVNLVFAFLILMLTLRISKSILLTFSDGLHDLLLTLGLAGFLAIGPTYYYFVKAVVTPKFKIKWVDMVHLLPAIIFTFFWIYIDVIREVGAIWHTFYRGILLQYMVYMVMAVWLSNTKTGEKPITKLQLNIISLFLLAIWFAYFLNEVAGLPYISGAILYSVLIYFSLIIVINKGYIIHLSNPKYQNTGLKSEENERLLEELKVVMLREKAYKDNTLSLAKLSKQLGSNTHAVSQVINENFQKTFFELIGYYRIEEAKGLLLDTSGLKISEVAYEVGYNSLSAFNTAFKKSTGVTPSKFKDEKFNT